MKWNEREQRRKRGVGERDLAITPGSSSGAPEGFSSSFEERETEDSLPTPPFSQHQNVDYLPTTEELTTHHGHS